VKVTQWFDGSEIPYREGVYQRAYFGDLHYARYINLFWRVMGSTPDEAANENHISRWQDLPWRGLVEAEAEKP
jgi:hypothetical protein